MYNTDFKVKYHDIEEELTWKLKNKTTDNTNTKEEPEPEPDSDSEYEYSSQDVLDICKKLYTDELTSVFYSDHLLDDKMDHGIKYICEKMLENPNFKQLLMETINEDTSFTHAYGEVFEPSTIFISLIFCLFRQESFYLFHKCICQQLTLGTIDTQLLDEIKKYLSVIST